jgi:hypothetical protein
MTRVADPLLGVWTATQIRLCEYEVGMLWMIFIVLLILWLLGLGLHFGGASINLLLVVALAVLVIKLSGPRAMV